MHDFLRDIPLFVAIARLKSFTQAAEYLGVGISTLSRRISQLEQALGVPVLYRNTRKVELTEVGKALLERCEFILTETDSAWESIVHNMNKASGQVRISMPEDCYHSLLKGALSAFASAWPEIQLRVDFSEQSVDLLGEPYDIFIRLGLVADTSCIVRKMFTVAPVLYASQSLVDRYGTPEKPEDILSIPCISLVRTGNSWIFCKEAAQTTVLVSPAHTFSSILLCHEFALAGHGLAMLRKHIAAHDEQEGKLIHLLPDWCGIQHNLYIITVKRQIPKRVRLLIDFLMEYCSKLQ